MNHIYLNNINFEGDVKNNINRKNNIIGFNSNNTNNLNNNLIKNNQNDEEKTNNSIGVKKKN